MKNSFCRVAVVFSLAIVSASVSLAETTEPLAAAEPAGAAEPAPMIMRPSGWSTQAAFSGVASTNLTDISWETPGFAWNALNVRFGGGVGNHRVSDSYVSFYTLQIGLKWTLARASSTGMTPYTFFGYRSFQPSGDSRPSGSISDSTNGVSGGAEFLIGTTWNHTFRPSETTVLNGGFFIEGGNIVSNFRSLPATTNARIADGFLIRLGFLRYL